MFSAARNISSKNPDPFCKVSDTLTAGQASALCLLLLPPLNERFPNSIGHCGQFFNKQARVL